MAAAAGSRAQVAHQLLADKAGRGLAEAPLHIGDDALKGAVDVAGAAVLALVMYIDDVSAGAVPEPLPVFLAERGVGNLEAEAVELRDALKHLVGEGAPVIPAADGAVMD